MTTIHLARRLASSCNTSSITKSTTALPFHSITNNSTNNSTSSATSSATGTTRRALSVSRDAYKKASEWKKSGDKDAGVYSQAPSEYKLGKHRSNALSLLQQQDIIMVDGDMAVCDGGGGALGHPLEYIKLGVRQDIGEGSEAEGIRCLYCGLRYRSKAHH